MYKSLFFVAFLGLVVACEKSGDNNGSTTQTPTPPVVPPSPPVVTPPVPLKNQRLMNWAFLLGAFPPQCGKERTQCGT